jgi:basic amino acid/polyamine antiporter, APA family
VQGARDAAQQAAGSAPAQAREHPALKRELSLLDAVGIGVNGIVGSGVYLLVAPLARVGGGSSVFGVLGCGVLCVLIALCFAELSSMYDRSGGPYVYARDAFGKPVGFAVGWLGMATGVLGLAAVSVGFAGALARFVPAAATARAPIGVGIVVILGVINWIGVKQGARTSTALSIVKIAPLVLLALAGLRVAPQAALKFDPRDAARAAFLSIFMMSGFEFAAVPAGEVRDAKRTVPLAVVGSIAGASALYALLQLASLGALPDLAAREQPLPDVAARALGAWGGTLLGVTALVSMLGFCAGVALIAPRYFTAMAEDGFLPAPIREVRTAIVASTAFASGLAVVLEYASLVDVSNVVILSGYALTCLAALVLRVRKAGTPRRYKPPLAVPVLAFGSAVALLAAARPRLEQWQFSAWLLAIGFACWAATSLARRALRLQP